jgi:hypothetical protein
MFSLIFMEDYIVDPVILREIDEKRLRIERDLSKGLTAAVLSTLEQDAIHHSELIEAGPTRKEQCLKKKNFSKTNESLLDAWKYAKGTFTGDLNNDFILKIASRIDKVNQGYRGDNVRMLARDSVSPISAEKIPEQMDILLEYINDAQNNLHPAEKAGILHFHFVRIHPLVDGNGRSARLLQNLILDTEGYAPAHIPAGERSIYRDLLKDGLRAYQSRDSVMQGAHQERFIDILLNSPPISSEESRFFNYLASKVNVSMEREIEVLNQFPKYRVVMEAKGSYEPGQTFSIKKAIQNYFSKTGRLGQIRVLNKNGQLEVRGDIDFDTLYQKIQLACPEFKFKLDQIYHPRRGSEFYPKNF